VSGKLIKQLAFMLNAGGKVKDELSSMQGTVCLEWFKHITDLQPEE